VMSFYVVITWRKNKKALRYTGHIPAKSNAGDVFDHVALALLKMASGVCVVCVSESVRGPLNVSATVVVSGPCCDCEAKFL